MKQVQLSKFLSYKEVIKGDNSNTQHMSIKLYSGDTDLIDLAMATISASAVPTSGSLENLKNPNNTTPVVFGRNEIVEINIEFQEMQNLHHLEVRHTNSGKLSDNNIRLTPNGADWYTVYDTDESGLFEETKPLQVKTNYWYDIDPLTGIILDIEDSSFFNPKSMIWDNDSKLKDFITKLKKNSQYYKMSTDSTNELVHLVNDEGIYPDSYQENIMINWIQLGTVSGVPQIRVKIGELAEVNAKFPGENSEVRLEGGVPYLGVYSKKTNTFLIASGLNATSECVKLTDDINNEDVNTALSSRGSKKNLLIKVDNIEELKKGKYKVGDIIEVLGYYSKNEGSCHKRVISLTDNGSGVQLNNKLWANIVHNGEVNVSWFGAKGDGVTDDTQLFNKILTYFDKIYIDRDIIVDKINLTKNKMIYGKKISAIQIQIGHRCMLKDISLYPKETQEDIPFLYINATEFKDTKAGISLNNINIAGRELERTNRDFCVIEISGNHGVWDIDINNIRSEQRANFRTMFKFKAHKSKTKQQEYPWITYTRVRNLSMIGGINMVEALTYYDEDGEYGYIQDDTGAEINVSLESCHFESNGLAKTMLRLGNFARVKMTDTFIGDFNQYEVQNENYIIIDNRNRKSLNGNYLLCHVDEYSLDSSRYNNYVSFIDKTNPIDLEDYHMNIVDIKSKDGLPRKDVLDVLRRYYELNYNYFTTNERHFILAKFPEKDIVKYINLCFILSNTNDLHMLNFFSINVLGKIDEKNVKFDTNIPTLKNLSFYKKGTDYFLVLKQTSENRLGIHIANLMLLSRKWYSYFWEGNESDFNALELELIYTANKTQNLEKLNTPYMATKMQQENVYDDFVSYMDEKTLYDKKQEKLEKDKLLAQEELKINPNLTYKKFTQNETEVDRMMLPTENLTEPKPSEKLQDFIDKWL